jgi:hypothetical protein
LSFRAPSFGAKNLALAFDVAFAFALALHISDLKFPNFQYFHPLSFRPPFFGAKNLAFACALAFALAFALALDLQISDSTFLNFQS